MKIRCGEGKQLVAVMFSMIMMLITFSCNVQRLSAFHLGSRSMLPLPLPLSFSEPAARTTTGNSNGHARFSTTACTQTQPDLQRPKKWFPAIKLATVVGLLGSVVLTDSMPSLAVDAISGPEAIEIRRVMGKLPSQDSISTSSTVTLPDGVQYFDVHVGEGDKEAREGSTVEWVLRRSNGYFVDSSTVNDNEPFIYKVGNTKKVIKGLDEAIRGMRAGGLRRVNVPPKAGFVEGVEDGRPGPLPRGFGPKRQILTRIERETWYFEIQMLKVK